MFTKIKHSPLNDTSEFTVSNSLTITDENALFVRVRRGAVANVYFSTDGGAIWSLLHTVDSSLVPVGSDVEVPDGATHINITSTTDKPVVVFPMSSGFSFKSASASAKYAMVGDTLPTSEKSAMNARLSTLESTDLGYRPMLIVDHNISAGGTTTPSADLAGLDGKSYIVYVDGKAIHPSLFSYANDGSFQFSFEVSTGTSITAVAWE